METWVPLTIEQAINQAIDSDLDIYTDTPVTHGVLSRYASKDFGLPIEQIDIIFEHGQYWCQFVNDKGELEQYSVIDSNNGIEFEEI